MPVRPNAADQSFHVSRWPINPTRPVSPAAVKADFCGQHPGSVQIYNTDIRTECFVFRAKEGQDSNNSYDPCEFDEQFMIVFFDIVEFYQGMLTKP